MKLASGPSSSCGPRSIQRPAGPLLSVRPCGLGQFKARRSAIRSPTQRQVWAHSVYHDVDSLPEPEWKENQVAWSRPSGQPRVEAPPGAPPIVILPGFGNASTDYTQPFGNEEAAIATRLAVRGWRPFVVPVERKEWFGVAKALLTLRFWRGQLTTDPGYTWYLEKVAATVERARRETGSAQVVLVGHSAGGWLGRAYLGDPRYQHPAFAASLPAPSPSSSATPSTVTTPAASLDMASSASFDPDPAFAASVAAAAFDAAAVGGSPPPPGTAGSRPHPAVRAMVTLGTPQRPPPPEKKRDMTGGAQGWVDHTYPGAFFADQGVAYLSICGRTVRGFRTFPRPREGPRIPEEYAYDSYMEVCGEAQGLEGDCVVPLRSAMLPGARRLVLDGVYHSMSKIGTFEKESGVVWYGSEDVLDCWLAPLVEELSRGAAGAAAAGQAAKQLVAEGAGSDAARA
ncbi:hypothetical protein HYH03_013856 [Edaphochlamys debaryana]|uniref:Uncharacterized protein n=1 Tax=Edaphochlamys debaryana TaxID=47281 RepID=A0A835XMH4_9CHLO|nr:hypothetical protein HYH03_013856 [Edaphochlamys debaryana]|eukprot:KAG2487577.1 hypothetical protein HYH03_013856 [Edaphochlamys debaryana]